MYMDGSPVFAGNMVYDLIYGQGKVQQLIASENRFLVSFGERVVSYRSSGHGLFTNRTLFWHNPIVGPPPKDSAAFGFYRELCLRLASFCNEQRDLVNKLLESNSNGE